MANSVNAKRRKRRTKQATKREVWDAAQRYPTSDTEKGIADVVTEVAQHFTIDAIAITPKDPQEPRVIWRKK